MIKPFFWPFGPSIPTSFSEELSFLQMVGALTEKLNEVIKELNKLEKKIPGN